MLNAHQIAARKGTLCAECSSSFDGRRRGARFCSLQCANVASNRRRWRDYDHDANLLPRFEAKFIPEPNSGCWLWLGATVPDGYGTFGVATGHTIKAHRVSWTLYRGPIPARQHVLHRCDTRACVNPDHLFLGDNAANVADRVAKGRSYRPSQRSLPC